MEEKEKPQDVHTMKRGRTEDSKVMMQTASDVIWNHGVVLDCASTGGHIWAQDLAAAGVCYHQSPGRHLWSGLPSGDLLMS